jgi:AraC-like DNA-binding protein
MRYQKFQPAQSLKSFVECYFVWEGEVKEKTDVQSPPNCFGAIVFNYGDSNWAYQNSTALSTVPDAFVCGLFTSNYHRVLNGKIGMIGIVFKATALHNFFGLRMSNLVNSRMPLDLLIGLEAFSLLDMIKKGNTDEDRIKRLEDFVLLRLSEAKKKLSIIDEACDYIDLKGGLVSVDEVATHLKISRRYLEKQFLQKVGVSPKFYSRIKRFGILSNKVAHSEKIDWQDVVLESGLHDQSHLAKEFLEFNRMNPTEYHQNHTEMTRFVKG